MVDPYLRGGQLTGILENVPSVPSYFITLKRLMKPYMALISWHVCKHGHLKHINSYVIQKIMLETRNGDVEANICVLSAILVETKYLGKY